MSGRGGSGSLGSGRTAGGGRPGRIRLCSCDSARLYFERNFLHGSVCSRLCVSNKFSHFRQKVCRVVCAVLRYHWFSINRGTQCLGRKPYSTDGKPRSFVLCLSSLNLLMEKRYDLGTPRVQTSATARTGSYFPFQPVFFVDTLTHTVRPRDGFKPVVGRMGDTLGHTSAAGTMRGRRRARGLAT